MSATDSRSAGFQTCRIADFPIGRAGELEPVGFQKVRPISEKGDPGGAEAMPQRLLAFPSASSPRPSPPFHGREGVTRAQPSRTRLFNLSPPVEHLVLLLGFFILLSLCSCASSPKSPTASLSRFEFQQPQMGLPFRMVLYAPDAASATVAASNAFHRISQLNDIMSDYDSDSELSRLSQSSGQGKVTPISADLWRVLERAQNLSVRSSGAFDVTVGPCVNLWRKARRDKQLPNPDWLARARKSVGYQHVRLDPKRRTVELLVPDMRLDLGGIAKGYAVDEALKVLKSHGIRSALVAGGGDIAVSDPPLGKTGWRVELPPLDVTNAPPARFVLLTHAALATSGDLFQRLEIDGKRYSHIVDPRTGIGLTDHSLVTVIARDCMTADSLTKVVSVLGPDAGLKLLKQTAGTEARVVRKPAEQIELRETAGFGRYYDKN